MINTTKATMFDVSDKIDHELFIMEDVEQEIFVVFECIDEMDEVSISEEGGKTYLIIRLPHSKILHAENPKPLLIKSFLKAIEMIDEDSVLFTQCKEKIIHLN